MKYRVQTTTGKRVNGRYFTDKEVAEKAYNNLRALFLRLGYTCVDAGGDDVNTGLCELWCKEGFKDKNIEIYSC